MPNPTPADMARLDRIEQLAREVLADTGYARGNEVPLARAVLAMLPVVRAAGRWYMVPDLQSDAGRRAIRELAEAVDEMRSGRAA